MTKPPTPPTLPEPSRTKRTVHKSTETLLTVPRYRDLIQDQDDDDTTERTPAVISTAAGWRTVMGKWIADSRAAEAEAAENSTDSDEEEVPTPPVRTGRAPAAYKWKKQTLATLFGGSTKKPAERLTQLEIDAEAALMVALAEAEATAEAEEDDRLDDGAVEIADEDEYIP
ncbi:hypothetical protein C8R43DRAFT_960377 [Mycena crocata]|nr:hypothetical protein C8R43DRAFT_960377 [Mycena crocata]